MSEVGTLKELGVKPGDVVEHTQSLTHYTVATGFKRLIHPDGFEHNYYGWDLGIFRIISRAPETPKLWRDMTSEEKGALLLARHEGKVIEYHDTKKWRDCYGSPTWSECVAYRIRPEPKIETVVMQVVNNRNGWQAYPSTSCATHRITFNTIDGKPDTASIRMDAI